MNWINAVNAVGAIATAGTLVSGFVLYRMGLRQRASSDLKAVIARVRSSTRLANRLITFDLAHEVGETVVFSRTITFQLLRVWDVFVNAPEPKKIELVREHMNSSFPAVTVPVHCQLVEQIEETLRTVQGDIARIQNDFPGLFRVFSPVTGVFEIVLGQYKRTLQNDEIWGKMIPEILEGEEFGSFEQFQHYVLEVFVRINHKFLIDHSQYDIDVLMEVIEIASREYLALNPRRLTNASRRERRTEMKPFGSQVTISDELREAEKALIHVLPTQKMLDYRERVAVFEKRNAN